MFGSHCKSIFLIIEQWWAIFVIFGNGYDNWPKMVTKGVLHQNWNFELFWVFKFSVWSDIPYFHFTSHPKNSQKFPPNADFKPIIYLHEPPKILLNFGQRCAQNYKKNRARCSCTLLRRSLKSLRFVFSATEFHVILSFCEFPQRRHSFSHDGAW